MPVTGISCSTYPLPLEAATSLSLAPPAPPCSNYAPLPGATYTAPISCSTYYPLPGATYAAPISCSTYAPLPGATYAAPISCAIPTPPMPPPISCSTYTSLPGALSAASYLFLYLRPSSWCHLCTL